MGNVVCENKIKKHGNWKGNDVGYWALHDWVTKELGQPKNCSMCQTTDPSKCYDWANVSGLYKRELSDFIRLCRKCHKKHDYHLVKKGEELPQAKLKEIDVLNIREMSNNGVSQSKISDKYNIDQSTVSIIVTRRIWKHI